MERPALGLRLLAGASRGGKGGIAAAPGCRRRTSPPPSVRVELLPSPFPLLFIAPGDLGDTRENFDSGFTKRELSYQSPPEKR